VHVGIQPKSPSMQVQTALQLGLNISPLLYHFPSTLHARPGLAKKFHFNSNCFMMNEKGLKEIGKAEK